MNFLFDIGQLTRRHRGRPEKVDDKGRKLCTKCQQHLDEVALTIETLRGEISFLAKVYGVLIPVSKIEMVLDSHKPKTPHE